MSISITEGLIMSLNFQTNVMSTQPFKEINGLLNFFLCLNILGYQQDENSSLSKYQCILMLIPKMKDIEPLELIRVDAQNILVNHCFYVM